MKRILLKVNIHIIKLSYIFKRMHNLKNKLYDKIRYKKKHVNLKKLF